MIEVKPIDKCYASCQVCGNDASENINDGIFAVKVANRYNQGAELHLCRDCCKDLRNLLKFTQLNGVKMVSIDDVDKAN